jgi:phage terminase large subunit-like protein
MHKGYDVVEIKQHSSVLHPATKLLSEKIENGQFRYEPNKLLEINFQNARCTYDTNMNRYVNKKKANGKVDMVVSLINATYLIQQDLLQNGDGFVSMVI